MVATISFNPWLTSNASGTFNITSDGYVQGTAMDDPPARNWLFGGVLATSETLPMWGGVGIAEHVPPAGTSLTSLGGNVTRATTLTANQVGTLTGFSVFDQAHHMVNSPQSQVPLAATGMSVHFYRLGSNARIAVACDPSLIGMQGGIISPQVSWDFNSQVLQPYDASTSTISITSQTATYAGGVYTVAVVTAAATPYGAVGDVINISGATNTGTGGAGLVNGSKVITSFTDNQHFSYQVTAPSGAIGTIGGTQVLNLGTGALNVRVLDVQVGNCMTVNYDPTTGFANWNRNGTCALILI